MTDSDLSIFQSHLDFTSLLWKQIPLIGKTVIDATCGNGYDSLKLALLALENGAGLLYCIDNQIEAITNTKNRLETYLSPEMQNKIIFCHQSHATLPNCIVPPSLIVYNLGYLPGGNKNLTTTYESTVSSLTQALEILSIQGLISITCYPGHEEGAKETASLLNWATLLPKSNFHVSHHQWINRLRSPSVLLIQKFSNNIGNAEHVIL